MAGNFHEAAGENPVSRRYEYVTKSERRFFLALYVAAGCGLIAAVAKLIADVAA